MTVASDQELLAALDAQVSLHEQGAERARADRRQVWLRMFEAGRAYAELQDLSGVSRTTMHTELRRARNERAQNEPQL